MQVNVETLEKGFLVNVFLAKSCPGLLVSVLEVFEELNLTVVQARASCTENFQLEAISMEVSLFWQSCSPILYSYFFNFGL